MPFRRKRRSAGRRRFRRLRRSARRRIKRVSRKVSQIIGANIQRLVTSDHSSSSSGMISSTHNSTGSSTNNGIVLLTGMGQGTGTAQRSGNRVQFFRLQMRGYTFTSVSGTTGSPVYNAGRIIVLLIKDNASSSLATGANDITTLLAEWQAGGGHANTLANYKSEMVPKRAVVLVDKYINTMNVNTAISTTTAGLGRVIPWRFSINLRRKTRGYTSYSGTGTGATSCENNHVFAYFIESNTTPGAANGLTSNWCYKASFLP